jgi:outer membrane lipase/esterase
MTPTTSVSCLTARLALAAGIGLCSLGAVAQTSTLGVAPSFSALYVFGDSLSDSGNNRTAFFGATGPNPTSATFISTLPYSPSGTYSNVPTWVSSFASGLGLSAFAAPSLLGGGNYAFGGATVSPSTPPAPFPPTLQAQLGSYLSSNAVSPNALYVLAGGGNDVRATIEAVAANPANIVALTTAGAAAYATATAQMVSTLRGAGASNVVVWNVPNVGLSPAALAGGPAAAGAASFISSAYNSALTTALASSGAQIFDLFGLVGSYVANPAAFGFTNVTQACGFAGNNCDPATALFWDGIHPTAYTQTLVAGAMLAAVPEPGTVWLFMAGLVGFGVVARRRQAAAAAR